MSCVRALRRPAADVGEHPQAARATRARSRRDDEATQPHRLTRGHPLPPGPRVRAFVCWRTE